MNHSIDVPLLEFDLDGPGVLEPSATQPSVDAPAAAVACFFFETVEKLAQHGQAVLDLPDGGPLWEIQHRGQRLGLFYPGIGAPLAAISLERVIAAGCRTIVACGGAGAIHPELLMGRHVIIVSSAIRDEGTSFHYIPSSREIAADPTIVAALSTVALQSGLPTIAGRTWTTDGLFRETPARIARRRDEDCLTVEMEASALLAVAAFRGVQFGQYLYAADDLSGEIWQDRGWREAAEVRQRLTSLAADAALYIQAGSQHASNRTL